eukprot:scaffold213_cov245-Pinguiococcus_pyrenoidosus.AAC.17
MLAQAIAARLQRSCLWISTGAYVSMVKAWAAHSLMWTSAARRRLTSRRPRSEGSSKHSSDLHALPSSQCFDS